MTTHREEELKHQLTSLVIAGGAIWTAVLAISVFAPDMVSGSEQQHMPVAAFTTWIFGLLATQSVLSFVMRTRSDAFVQRGFAMAVAAVWLVATGFAVLGPEMVTGSDPTRIPLFAILAPIVAMILTRCGAELARTVAETTDRTEHSVPTSS